MIKNIDFNKYNEEELRWIIKNAMASLNSLEKKKKYKYNIGDTVKVISREAYEKDNRKKRKQKENENKIT